MKKLILLGSIFLTMFHIYAYSTENVNDLLWRYEVNEGSASLYGHYSAGINGSYSLGTCVDRQTAGKIIIPTLLGGYPVKGIKSFAFRECSLIEGVIIPDGVLNIGDYAFEDCTSIKEVEMPNSVTSIGSYAFERCTSLKSVIIPGSVTNVDRQAFQYCSAMTNAIVYGTGLYHYWRDGYGYSRDSSPFNNCSNLVSVMTMDTCAYMFNNCNKMQEITLLDGMERIKAFTFYSCKWLKEIEIPNSVTSIDSHAFSGCSALEKILISGNVKSIGSGAFRDCSALEKILLSGNVKSIGSGAFSGCSSLIDIDGLPQCVCERSITNAFKSSYQAITNIVVAPGVTRIAADCFKDCYALKRIVIPASVTAIYDNAFQNCSALEEIVFLGDAPDVGSEIFIGTPRSLKITVKEGSVGWEGGVSTELPEVWPVGDATAREITYSGSNEKPEGGGSSGGESAVVDARYNLADDVADRAIANVEIDGDAAIDSFVLKDGKVYDSVVRIVNTSASAAKISLPGGFIYEKFKGTKPLEIPATSTNLLTITRTKGDTFLLAREELVLEVQE